MRPTDPLIALAAVALLALATAADARTRAECERTYTPHLGQAGKDVLWEQTPDELVNLMLTKAMVTAEDHVVDLGAGDGKIPIAAAKDFGATAVGIEYDLDLAKLAQCYVEAEGLADRVRIIRGDIFKEDFSKATVVTMYLLPELNVCLRHRILAMAPGTRVTSHSFTMGEWQPDERFAVESRNALLWIVPARVGGTWSFRGGDIDFTLALNQSYQRIGGEVTLDGAQQPLIGASLNADKIRFTFNDAEGVTRYFSGTVKGASITGSLRASGIADMAVIGSLQDAHAPAPWAEMARGCGRYYAN
jgi:hypothetical protein